MFRIGDFSKIARVSARLLRFYDETGLFTPAHADSQTGYRYYTVGQLAQLNRILVLKDLGFNLDQVRDILSSNVSAAELRNMLLLRRNDVEQTLAAESQRLHRIETRIAQLESEGTLSADDVVVRREPMRRVLSLRRIVPSFSAARELILEIDVRLVPPQYPFADFAGGRDLCAAVLYAAVGRVDPELQLQLEISRLATAPDQERVLFEWRGRRRLADNRAALGPPQRGITIPTGQALAVEDLTEARVVVERDRATAGGTAATTSSLALSASFGGRRLAWPPG